MRVTNKMLMNTALINIQRQTNRLFEAQQAVASGKRVQRPSDDPVGTRRILDLRGTLASFEQFKSNRGMLNSLLDTTDTALNNVGDILTRAKELALAGSNATAGPSDRDFIRQEVGQLFAHVMTLGNTDVGGRFIFAGRASDQPPFSRLVSTAGTTSGLTASGGVATMNVGDLQINSTTIRVPVAADDTVSTSDNTASALALREAINASTAATGVRAEADTTLSLTATSFGNLAGTDFEINGVTVTGTVLDANSLVAAVNAANIPGVLAFSTGANNLSLQAADGRNIQLQTTGLSAGGMAFTGFDLAAGVALDQTTAGTVILTSDTPFTIAGTNPGSARLSAGAVNITVGRYSGGSGQIDLEISSGQRVGSNIVGSEFLVSDLRPNVDATTPLSHLRQGQGIAAGAIQITDRVGNTATVDLTSAKTVGDVINAISGVAGVNVTAAISPTGNGLTITDDNPTAIQNLTIDEVGSGKTASDLGILADRPGHIAGAPLDAVLSETTPLALLHDGKGMISGPIHIANDNLEADVDLSPAQTIGDVLSLISGSGLNVTAHIGVDGTTVDVRSNDPTTVAIVTEVNNGTTASDLGIQGSNDILKTLSLLQEALQQNDVEALDRLSRHIDTGIDRVLELRGDTGARMNRVELAETRSADLLVTTTELLSRSEDADIFEAASRLASFDTALQAALAATARTVQLSLLDFLR